MSEKKDGGPAFPQQLLPDHAYDGMSLRDWFAGLTLMGKAAVNGQQLEKERKWLAEDAYRIADAMLAERDK